MTKKGLNDEQKMIATTLDGFLVVDAGPGTGKTHTIVERYLNILKTEGLDQRDILLMTFTNNAAEEMKERLKTKAGTDVQIQTSTFSSFCLNVVLESPESVSSFLRMKEHLTRNAKLVENETLNSEYFENFYAEFIKRNGHKYGSAAALTSFSAKDVYSLLKKLMTMGIMPLPDYEWFGIKGLEGNMSALRSRLSTINTPSLTRSVIEYLNDRGLDDMGLSFKEPMPEGMLDDAVNEPREQLLWLFHDIFYEYLRASISDNRLTFGLADLFALAVLYGDREARKRSSFRYVMIDEFQDTNELQLKIAMMILKEPNLCVVGDWKQGIFGFRDASIDNITEFGRKVKEIKKELNEEDIKVNFDIPKIIEIPMVINYRSSQKVIDTAFDTLRIKASASEELDETLLNKITRIKQDREDIKENTAVEFYRSETPENEILTVLWKIQDYVTSGKYTICEKDTERQPEYKDIAVLCRGNGLCRKIRDKAEELGIPVYLQGDVEVMASKEGKLALAWLRYVNNRKDSSGRSAILADAGYSLAEMEQYVKDNDDASNKDDMPREYIDQRKKLVKKKKRLNDLLTSIFSFYDLNNDMTQAIVSILSSAHRNTLLTISDIIRLIEEDIKEVTAYPLDPLLNTEAVTIQTMHKSKGLEYPIVMIAGINEKSFPSSQGDRSKFRYNPLYGLRSLYEYRESDGFHTLRSSWKWAVIKKTDSREYDEERRLFFVAVSRAKQYVTMTCWKPSRFILAFGEENFVPSDPALDRIVVAKREHIVPQPIIEPYSRRRVNLSVHDLMDLQESVGKGDEAGGKGKDYGTKVHEAAHLLASGKRPKEEFPEIPEIERILDSVKSGDILTEIECTLPIGNVMIRGIIDMLAVFPDRVEIHDYKTDADRSYLQKYEIQLSVYALSAGAYFKRPVKCFVDFLSLKEIAEVVPLTMDEISDRVKTLVHDL
jgi:Superfamily I DNA and RNA helicases